MRATKSEVKSVFIASSSEAYKKGYLDPITKVLKKNGYQPKVWKNEFPAGEIFLEKLVDIVNNSDFAIFVFAEDLTYNWRNLKDQKGTAWNVILEYGMFYQSLNKERAIILRINESHIPTDLSGLIWKEVKGKSDLQIKTEIEKKVKEIIQKWYTLTSILTDEFGIVQPLKSQIENLKLKLDNVTNTEKFISNQDPIELNEQLLISLYVKGLRNVKNKFLTTTYLSSGFWAHKTNQIISANLGMIERLKKASSPDIRRLFLLRHDFDTELEILKRKLFDYRNRKNGGEQKLIDLKTQFEHLTYIICEQFSEGDVCKIHYVYDEKNFAHIYLPELIQKDDTEIAIYDDFRIDFFEGGKKKKISGIKIFIKHSDKYRETYKNANDYFEALWKKSLPITELLTAFNSIINRYERKIDYNLNKLNNFEEHDTFLKDSELSVVKKYLTEELKSKKIDSYLDIGTCTGRYPLEFVKILDKNCKIEGIDYDIDCIEFIRAKIKEKSIHGVEYPNLTFSHHDFLTFPTSTKYDLITCMLGTISHFDSNTLKDNDKSELDELIEKLYNILNKKGILILSNWTKKAEKSGYLSIYNNSEVEIIKKYTLSKDQLSTKLKKFKFHVIPTGQNADLDIFICTK